MSGQVSPIPEGYHSVTPRLIVRGAAEAIAFYGRAFSARDLGRHEGSDGKIIHAVIEIGDSRLFLVDEMPGMDCLSPQSYGGGTTVPLTIYVPDPDALFTQAIAAGAKPIMPMSDAFWGERYGMLADPFGHRWSVACRIKNLSDAELAAAAKAAFAGGKPSI